MNSTTNQMVTKTKQNLHSPSNNLNYATHSQSPKAVFHSDISEYEVGKLVGSGSFGQVYAAKTKNGYPVAIKIIEKKRAIRQRVEAEERIHSSLKHPSIIEFLHRFEDQQKVYFVLELAKGNLYKFLLSRTQPLSEGFVAYLFKQLVLGVKYLRKQGVAHRDVKPSNLLLCPSHDTNDSNNNNNEDRYEVCLKMGDFGLAAKQEEVTSDFRTFCGTREFMAPEISKQKYGLEADLYSLGMVLYALLVSGVGQNLKSKLKNLSHNHQFEFPKHSSVHARDLVMKLLKEDPDERPLPEEVLLHPFVTLNTHSNTQRQQTTPSITPTPNIIINQTTTNNTPLDTKRIKPLELKTKWGMAWITEEGDLCLQPHPQRIFRITSNGLNFYVIAPNTQSNNSPTQQNTQILEHFSFPNLPEKYLRWYEYGRLFLGTVRARIPKVTLYTDFCRAILMESMAHFEAVFFSNSRSPTPSSTSESGIKILYSKTEDKWTFLDNSSNPTHHSHNNTTMSFSPQLQSQTPTMYHATISSTSSGSTTGTLSPSPSPSTSRSSSSTNSNPSFSLTPHEMLDHAKSSYRMCLQYERVISRDDDTFPIEIIKRRKSLRSPSPSRITSTLSFYSPPNQSISLTPPQPNKETTSPKHNTNSSNTHTVSHQNTQQTMHTETHQNKQHTNNEYTRTQTQQTPPRTSSPDKTKIAPVFLKSIGWAFRMPLTGEIWFHFNDGTQVVLSSDAKTLKYTPLLGNTSFHEVSYALPKHLQEKLSHFPTFFELIKDAH
eukprot:TRINITY_DN1169_c1_g1_i1.p1 TRINITY_DN1169_c1_g1~~TRINITY_DN1169_c1_g1_i1.p1  ORF type:complete len:771 (-),score=177.21 TRINITY_DN1169_c1_g1_i1:104-2416(-)